MADDSAQAERQLVIFDLAAEAYGVDISTVREIIRMQEITRMPRTPEYVEGVINLRGKVTPVVDLRKRFGLAEAEGDSQHQRIVVVDTGTRSMGFVVDAVSEVLRVPVGSIEPPSSVVTSADSDYLVGIVKLPDRLISLLDLERLLEGFEAAPVAG
ncbi:MAG: chemotaxis protein CheW [Chloroflexi bacterium]|nr:chemotaxis protein CheW [Chloroflexota bacterium]MCH7655641.1 chemotaxis protein CheW [Chloroflexota bacterium]